MSEPKAYVEVSGPEPVDPVRAVIRCIEEDTWALLFDRGALPGTFFDLSTGLAGEVTQKLMSYGVRVAAVVPDVSVHSERFQEFAREANKGRLIHFAATREHALAWLERSG
jgi:hypothetical protein